MGSWRKALAGLWLVPVVIGACASDELAMCSSDADCPSDSVCVERLCVGMEPEAAAPRVVLTADKEAARIGEVVLVDAGASSGNGSPLEFEFRAEPDGAAFVEVVGDGSRAQVRRRVGHLPVEVVVTVRTAAGATGEGRIGIGAINSVPEVELAAVALPFQPGASVELRATAFDADEDELTFEWTLRGTAGSLEGAGESAVLHTVAGVEAIDYPVEVRVLDGMGGERRAQLTLRPENQPPSIELEVEPVDHQCAGDPLVCSAAFTLAPRTDDTGPVRWIYRLLDDRAYLSHRFVDLPDGTTRIELACSPACPIAGIYRLEVRARDSVGAESVKEVDLEVRNRAPIVRAHDGTALPHSTTGSGSGLRYVVERASGAVLTWEDPDGDPPDPETIEWSGSPSIVTFEDPRRIDTALRATGTREQLLALELVLFAADINGAQAADRAAVPVANEPPRVSFGGDSSAGHTFHRKEADGTRVYRKAISLAALEKSDPEGDPLQLSLELVPPQEPITTSVRLLQEGGTYYLEGIGPGFIGRNWKVRARVTDSWGAQAESVGEVRVSNRPPVIQSRPDSHFGFQATACERRLCCYYMNIFSGKCEQPSWILVGTAWEGGDPLQHSVVVTATDPDGDPISLDVRVETENKVSASVEGDTGWGSHVTRTCLAQADGSWRCPVGVRLRAKTTFFSLSCILNDATAVSASAGFSAEASDGLGGTSGRITWSQFTADGTSDRSCR